jgi:hypothetical protein
MVSDTNNCHEMIIAGAGVGASGAGLQVVAAFFRIRVMAKTMDDGRPHISHH